MDEFGGEPTQGGAVFDAAAAGGGGGGGPGAWRASSRGGGGGIHHGSMDGGNNGERFSRKVFVGGLPPDIDEGEGRATSVHVLSKFLKFIVATPKKRCYVLKLLII